MMPNGNEAKATLCMRLLGAPASSAELVQKMHAITSSIREGGVRRSAAAICIALPGRHADCTKGEIYRGPLDEHSRELQWEISSSGARASPRKEEKFDQETEPFLFHLTKSGPFEAERGHDRDAHDLAGVLRCGCGSWL